MEKVKKDRESSIELLRIFAALGVIILHYNNANIGGGFKYVGTNIINTIYLNLTESLCSASVNIFILITGYFMIRKKEIKYRKLVDLFSLTVFLRLFAYIVQNIMGMNTFSIKGLVVTLIPTNYFLILYSVLYLILPYINRLMCTLTEKEQKKMLTIFIAVFSIYSYFIDCFANLFGETYFALSPIGLLGSAYGTNIVNFILVYAIGGYLKLNNVNKSFAKSLFTMVGLLLGLMLLSNFGAGAFYYNNPLVIGIAVELFLIFKSFHFNNNVINFLSKSSFACYILHSYFLGFFNIKFAVTQSVVYLFVHQLLVITCLFMLSVFVHQIYLSGQRVLKLFRKNK